VVPDINPLLGAYAAATRRSQSGQLVAPEEAVSLEEALRLFTHHAAQACGEGQHRGTLEPGKAADFVILGADPFAVSLHELPDVPVEGVFIGGQEADLTVSV
jgi:predicted amidohydrolase YtcJ